MDKSRVHAKILLYLNTYWHKLVFCLLTYTKKPGPKFAYYNLKSKQTCNKTKLGKFLMIATVLLQEDLRSSSLTIDEKKSLETSQNHGQGSKSNRNTDKIIVLRGIKQTPSCEKEGSQIQGHEQISASDDRLKRSIKAYHSTLKSHARWASSPTKIIKNL